MSQLHIEREIALPVERVFAAWTQPELLCRWFAPGENMTCKADTDLTVGGAYRIEMHDPDSGEDHIVVGEYSIIEPNQRLAFSWRWHSSEVTTQVDIRFTADGAKTRLDLRHTDFPDAQMCDKHSMGWNGCLAKLESRSDQLAA